MSYKVELVEKKYPINQLEASKSSIKDFFIDLLNETKGFKYQTALRVMLKNTKILKLNLLQFISIQQQKQWYIINLLLKMLFKKFCTGLITGLIKGLAGLVN